MLDSSQNELQQTAGESEANSNTIYHNNEKYSMCNAMMKEVNL